MALVKAGFPVLLLGQADESLKGVVALTQEFASLGATVISAGVPGAPGIVLPRIPADPLIEPILHIASFYRFANALALARGRNPDRPPHLAKVTETV
jgi:glucosamine--fructose-6-phosphate aminotransferase (isomerizing)